MSELIYLYGFVPADVRLPTGGLAGVADAGVDSLPLAGFAAAVSRLPVAEFGAEALEARLRDLPWVAEQGLAHERVVAWFVDHAEILPAPLFTLYSSPELLQAEAASRAGEVERALGDFAGLREWDLKVTYLPARLAEHLGELSPEVAELDRRIAQASPGTRFLLERKRDALARTETARAARESAAGLLEALAPLAERSLRLPLAQTDGSGPVALNSALLVRRDREAALATEFAARRAELERLGIAAAFSGPWAPYRFVAEER